MSVLALRVLRQISLWSVNQEGTWGAEIHMGPGGRSPPAACSAPGRATRIPCAERGLGAGSVQPQHRFSALSLKNESRSASDEKWAFRIKKKKSSYIIFSPTNETKMLFNKIVRGHGALQQSFKIMCNIMLIVCKQGFQNSGKQLILLIIQTASLSPRQHDLLSKILPRGSTREGLDQP